MTSAKRRRTISRPSWRALGWPVIWMIVAAAIVIPHLFAYPSISPVDELQHIDYLAKMTDLELVDPGERIGETAMREQACRGLDSAFPSPPCDTPEFDPARFQEAGFNTAYGDPPGYYAVTAVVAALIQATPWVDGLVAAGRSVGVLWLGSGLWLTWLLSKRLGARSDAAVGATLLVATTPAVVHASATITSDAPALTVGGILALTALAVDQRRISPWWLLPAAFSATAIKLTMVTVLGAVAVFLLLPLLSARRRRSGDPAEDSPETPASPAPRRFPFAALTSLVIGAVLPVVLWMLVSSSRAMADAGKDPMTERFKVPAIGWNELAANATALVSPVKGAYVPLFLDSHTVTLLATVVNLLLVVGLVGVSWFRLFGVASTRLGTAACVSMLVSGPVFVVLFFVGFDSYIAIPARYGMSLVPIAVACVALMASQRRLGGLGVLVLGLTSCGVLLSKTL